MNRGFVFILILAVGLVVTSCLRQGKQNVTYDFTPLDSIISTWMDKGYYPGGAICVIKNDSVLFGVSGSKQRKAHGENDASFAVDQSEKAVFYSSA